MSIDAEYAKQHENDPAILCCRAEAGTVLTSHNLEDPEIFPDLVDSGLLNVDNALKIKQVLNGSKLTKTVDSLTPVTPDIIDKFDPDEGEADSEPEAEVSETEVPSDSAIAPVVGQTVANGGTFKLHIGEGKDIDLEIPLGLMGGEVSSNLSSQASEISVEQETAPSQAEEELEVVKGTLKRKYYQVTEVKRGPETKLEGTVLTIREGVEADVIASEDLVTDFKLEIITADKYHTYSETVMDVQPIATKEEESEIGSGNTRVVDGAVMMLTGTDEKGVQIGEFGSSDPFRLEYGQSD